MQPPARLGGLQPVTPSWIDIQTGGQLDEIVAELATRLVDRYGRDTLLALLGLTYPPRASGRGSCP
jgi:hypothetical protein